MSEDARLKALQSTRLLDSLPEPAFDRLTQLAASLLGAPVALVSLVDDHRQFFKSAFGLAEPWATRRETPLTHSFCQHATRDRKPLVVDDARVHPVLHDNLAIRDLDVIAYAGIPLFVDDEAIGAFCVIDDKPRAWTPQQVRLLENLAATVTAEIELRAQLRATEERRALADALLESVGDAVLAIDAAGTLVVMNEAARAMFAEGVEVGKPFPANWRDMHRTLREDGTPLGASDGALGRGLRGEDTNGLVVTIQRPGSPHGIWVEACARPVRDRDGRVIAAVAAYRDVSERKRREAELREERALFASTLAHIEDGVVLLDAGRRVLLANEAYAQMFGLSSDVIVGLTRDEFIAHASTLVHDPIAFEDVVRKDVQEPTEEFLFVRPRRRILRRTWTPLEGGSGTLVTWHDVTAERDLLHEHERQLMIDALTGVANRRALEGALRVEHERMKRAGTALCVAIFDVDHFKQVNDVHGHSVGDDVLRRVASTLAAQARLTDTVGRWGGEEFLAVLPVALDGARAFCERVRLAIENMQCPPVDRVTISAGVAQLGSGESTAEAVQRADARLYEAKRGGRNQVGL